MAKDEQVKCYFSGAQNHKRPAWKTLSVKAMRRLLLLPQPEDQRSQVSFDPLTDSAGAGSMAATPPTQAASCLTGVFRLREAISGRGPQFSLVSGHLRLSIGGQRRGPVQLASAGVRFAHSVHEAGVSGRGRVSVSETDIRRRLAGPDRQMAEPQAARPALRSGFTPPRARDLRRRNRPSTGRRAGRRNIRRPPA